MTRPVITLPSLLPWLFVPVLTTLKLIARTSADFGEALFSSASPLLWEGVAVGIAVIIMGVGRIVSGYTSHPLALIVIAVAVYATIPAASLGSRYLVAPTVTIEEAFSQYPEGFAITLASAALSITLVAPLLKNRERQDTLATEQARLEGLLATAASHRKDAHADITHQVTTVVVPEVERVVSFLKKGPLSPERVDIVVADIHRSVSEVIKPFSERLIKDTNTPINSAMSAEPPGPAVFGWANPVAPRNMLLPSQTAIILGALLGAVITRDAGPTNPVTFPLLAFVVALTGALWAGLTVIRALMPQSWKISPALALAFLAPANAVLYVALFGAINRIPPSFLDYGTWGFVTDFPNSVITAVIAGPTLAIGGAFNARRKEILERTEAYQREIEHEVAALKTEIWHVRRQTGLMVHGSLQGALIATGLHIQQSGNNEPKVAELVARLESGLRDVSGENPREDILEFLDSLADAWTGLCAVTSHVNNAALAVLSSSPPASAAVAEVAREGLNNAVFHGKAQNVDISVSALDNRTLLVSVTNDGQEPPRNPGEGLGTQLLNTVTQSWALERKNNTTHLTATIALTAPKTEGLEN